MVGLANHDPYRLYDSMHSMIHLSFWMVPFLPLFDWKRTQDNPLLSQSDYLARGAVNILEMNSLVRASSRSIFRISNGPIASGSFEI